MIFIYHYSKYIWLYPLRLKLDVTIFRQFKALVETFFKTKIISVYSDGGGEYIALRDFLATHGIQHLNTSSHTLQHNGIVKYRHKHIVDIGLTLLHQAKLPSQYWLYVFMQLSI